MNLPPELEYVLVAVVFVPMIIGALLVVFRASTSKPRQSEFTLMVHYLERPTIGPEVVNDALAEAFPGLALTTTTTSPNEWIAKHPHDGEYIVRLRVESIFPPNTGASVVSLFVFSDTHPSKERQQEILANQCRVAAAFARRGGAFVSRAYTLSQREPRAVKVDASVLEQLSQGVADHLPS